ncbi:MAG: glycosyltransferase family A protein [Sumerlaeia bacterium]
MKFHALLPVANEADILPECLDAMLTWADGIWVFDTGSVDDSWEIVLDYADKNKAVRPIKKDPVYYSEPLLRGYIFETARKEMKDGDWFLRVDADEFHHLTPQQMLKERLRPHETIVYHQYYDFQLLESEAAALDSPEAIEAERQKPIAERRRHYIPSVYSEPRMCKYRSTMKWPRTAGFPVNAGFVAVERYPIRHYPHRDPAQLDRRCRLRSIMLADKNNQRHWRQAAEHHWAIEDWRKFIVKDDDDRPQHWAPGTDLPHLKQTNHIAKPHKRLAQRLVHAFMLPTLDKKREGFPADAYPDPIGEDLRQAIRDSLLSDEALKAGPEGHTAQAKS